MTDALLATGAAVLLAAGALAGLGLLTVLPWYVAVGLAERRGLGAVRWGAAGALGGVLGVVVVLQALRSGPPLAALQPDAVQVGRVLLGVLAAWAVPLALALRRVAPGRLAGVRGRHE